MLTVRESLWETSLYDAFLVTETFFLLHAVTAAFKGNIIQENAFKFVSRLRSLNMRHEKLSSIRSKLAC